MMPQNLNFFKNFLLFYINVRARGGATNWQVTGSIPDGVIGIFQWHDPSGRPGVDSASNSNEYQVCFLGVKAAGV